MDEESAEADLGYSKFVSSENGGSSGVLSDRLVIAGIAPGDRGRISFGRAGGGRGCSSIRFGSLAGRARCNGFVTCPGHSGGGRQYSRCLCSGWLVRSRKQSGRDYSVYPDWLVFTIGWDFLMWPSSDPRVIFASRERSIPRELEGKG